MFDHLLVFREQVHENAFLIVLILIGALVVSVLWMSFVEPRWPVRRVHPRPPVLRPDPLATLMFDIESDEKREPACLSTPPGAPDPVRTAWEASGNPRLMVYLMEFVRGPVVGTKCAALLRESNRCYPDDDAMAAACLRAGVRAPTLDEVRETLRRNDAGPDPLDELVRAVEREGRPEFVWVLRWAQGGREPVSAAWEASCSAVLMVKVLRLCGRGAEADAVIDAYDLRSLESIEEALRAAIKPPPTLDELVRCAPSDGSAN